MGGRIDLVCGAEGLSREASEWDALVEPFDERARYELAYEFVKAIAPDYAVPYEEYFAEYPDWDVYAILVDGKIAARAAIYRIYEGAREVANVWTHPEHRGRGMATALVRRLAGMILDQGLVPTLTTREHNAPMRAAARKAGFCEISAWYHGSPLELKILRAGSAITPFRPLAEAFSRKPARLEICGDGSIRHDGTLPGMLYAVDEPLEIGKDMLPHPRSSMGAEKEWITARELRLRRIADEEE